MKGLIVNFGLRSNQMHRAPIDAAERESFMVLTERDKKIFSDLKNYSVLTTTHIARRNFPGVALTTVLRRLRRLEACGFVRRIEGLASNERCWMVTRKANQDFSDSSPRTMLIEIIFSMR
jgi:Fe2+ or Zn2+ uptake regulation protein